MVEGAILVLVIAIFVGAGLSLWLHIAGRAQRRLLAATRVVTLLPVVVPLVLFATYRLMNARELQLFGGIVPRVSTREAIVALTFDDGPRAPYTEQLLSILREKDAKATFFAIGENIENNPALAEEIVRQGHELGNHSFSHKRMIFKSPAFIRSEIERTNDLIRRSGQSGTIHFRSPYGKKLLLLPLYLRRTGRANIFFDVEADPRPDAPASRIAELVLTRTKPGSIILMHAESSRRAESLKAVPAIIDGLESRGFRFVTVSELMRAHVSR